jgi:hypothetical protein
LLDSASVVVATRDQLSSNLDGEAVILHLTAGTYYGLDEVGARVWALVQEPRRVADLCRVLLAEYDVEPARCERAVLALLEELAGAGLIETVDAPAA